MGELFNTGTMTAKLSYNTGGGGGGGGGTPVDAYTKEESDARYARKNTTLSGYGITDAFTKAEVNDVVKNATGGSYTKEESDGRYARQNTTLSGYGITDAYTKAQVDKAIAEVASSTEYEVVDALPTTGDKGKLYFVKSPSDPDVYDEYTYIGDKWVHINTIDVDLSSYLKKTDAYTKTEANERFAEAATTLAGYGITDAYSKTEADERFAKKSSTAAGYGITDVYTKEEANEAIGESIAEVYTKEEANSKFVSRGTTLNWYGINDAYTKDTADTKFAQKANTLLGYGITNAYSKSDADGKFAAKSSTLAGYGITNAYTKTETDKAITKAMSEITSIKMEVVDALPDQGADGTFYLMLNGGVGNNIYDEYIYYNARWEKIGTTEVDMSNYLKVTDIVEITDAQIDAILAL